MKGLSTGFVLGVAFVLVFLRGLSGAALLAFAAAAAGGLALTLYAWHKKA